jgi:hypothetical protein
MFYYFVIEERNERNKIPEKNAISLSEGEI